MHLCILNYFKMCFLSSGENAGALVEQRDEKGTHMTIYTVTLLYFSYTGKNSMGILFRFVCWAEILGVFSEYKE